MLMICYITSGLDLLVSNVSSRMLVEIILNVFDDLIIFTVNNVGYRIFGQ